MSGLQLRPTLSSFFTGIVTAFFAVFLFASPAFGAQGEAYLIVPDMVLGNVEGTEEVFSSLYTELEKQGVLAENIVNFRYDPYDGITTIIEELSTELDTLTQVTGDTEISILGYGVGGLIIRNYLESESFRDNIESVVFGATPHEGSIAYTEHIYGKNITYLNAWERLYWEGKEVPMLMKQVLPTNLPLVGVTLEDEALTPLREAVTYSIIDDLKNREQDPDSPIKNLQVTNLRPSGYFDGWYYTPKNIGQNQATTNQVTTSVNLANSVVLNLEKRTGDGYISKAGASFAEGITRDYWAKHEEIIHQGIRDVLTGLGLSTSGIANYHPQSIYDNGIYQYPREYHTLGFKVDITEDSEVASLPDLTFPDTVKYQEEGRILYFQTTYRTLRSNFILDNPISLSLKSHGRQTIYLSQFLANSRDSISYRFDSFESEVGEEFTFTQTLSPYCSGINENVKCTFNTFEERNIWTVSSREWIQYPIVLVHGILGSINADMLFSIDKDANTGFTGSNVSILGMNPTGDTISGEQWYTIPFMDKSWDRMIPTLEAGGLEQNKDFFVFSYDWRYPNQVSAYRFKEYIEKVQDVTDSKKVNVVAHSMGGLVARAYIEDMANPFVSYDGNITNESESLREPYQNNIARFVMAGTPNMGSGTAIPRWYGGDTISGNIGLTGTISYYGMQWYLDAVSPDFGKEVVRRLPWGQVTQRPFAKDQLRRQAPSTRDLLPTYDQTMLARVHTPTLLNPANFEEAWLPRISDNVFLDTLNSRSNSEDSNLKGIDTLAIAGVGQDTIKEVHFLKENPVWRPLNFFYHPWSAWGIINNDETYWFDKLVKNLVGDNTVLQQSVHNLSTDIVSNSLVELDNQDAETAYEHGTIYLFEDTLRLAINKVFPDFADIISEEVVNEYIKDSVTVNIYSPADISVTLSDGTVVSKEMPESEMIEKGIVYISQGEGGHKSLFIPNISEGEYEVQVNGTGEGEYTLQTKYADDEGQLVYARVTSETFEGKEEAYSFSIEKDEEGKISEEAITLVPSNTPPVATLDQETYEGVEGDEIIFDGASSNDEDGDTLRYQWAITDGEGNEVVATEFTENPSYAYTFEELFTGTVTLTVTDGELEDFVTSEIVIRALTFEEKISQIQGLLESLEEDTSYMRSKKRLWIQLVDLLELPQVEKSDRLQRVVKSLLQIDIERSLILDNKLERTWMWWRRMDLINDRNEETLRVTQEKLKDLL